MDAISTFILVVFYGLPEQNFILNILHYLISDWAPAIVLWFVIIFAVFISLRKILGYNLRREYRAVVLVYILSLLIAITGNIFLLIKAIAK